MRYSIGMAVVAALLMAVALPISALAADTYTLDPAHTQTIFTIDHLGYSTVTGNFHDLKGMLVLDTNKPVAGTIEVTIDTASVDTGVAARDEDLRSPSFFNVEKFPTMVFKSTRVKKTGLKTADISGNLTLLGITRPIIMKVKLNLIAPDPLRGNAVVAGFTASAHLRRSDYGMTSFLPLIGDEVGIVVNAEAVKR